MRIICIFGAVMLTAAIFVSCSSNETEGELWSKSRVLLSEEKYDEAIKVMKQLLRNFPEGENAADTRFSLADTYANIKKDYDSAVMEYRKVTLDYPESNLSAKAQFMIGYIYANYVKDLDKARAAYLEYQDKYADSELSGAVDFELEYLGRSLDEIPALEKAATTEE